MKYLLDSNTVSDLYNKESTSHHKIIGKLGQLENQDEVFISILTLYEFEYALANTPAIDKDAVQRVVTEIKQDFIILPLSNEGAGIFGGIKKSFKELNSLNKNAIKKHTIDIILAATAVEYGTIVVSADNIFNAIATFRTDLRIEDWTR